MRGCMGWWVVVGLCACSGRGIVDEDDDDDGEGDGSSEAGSATVASVGDASVGDDGGPESGSIDGGESSDDGAQGEDRQWLLAMASVISPQTPLQWHVVADWEGDQVIGVSVQSLSLDPGSTTAPREPLGSPTNADDLAVDDLGGFGMSFAELVVPGAANPITGGDIVFADVRFIGMGTNTTSCGVVMGTVTAPIMLALDGSTFAAVPITSVDDLPLEFPSACE
ncbi:MAG TPA: hypothetical protein VFG69_00035 [Nannocystaceae bacterium]|nr:hypothetical protein [Nannocystaceae bacterium]